MRLIQIVLDGRAILSLKNAEEISRIENVLPINCKIQKLQRFRTRAVLYLSRTQSIHPSKLAKVGKALSRSTANPVYSFGTGNSDLDLAVFFPNTIARAAFISGVERIVRSLSVVWPRRRIISLSRFSTALFGAHGYLHLTAYRGIREFKDLETPLLGEAIVLTGNRIQGGGVIENEFKLSTTDILRSYHAHKRELSLASLECLNVHGITGNRLVAKYVEYHSRHLLLSLVRLGNPPTRSMFHRHGLLVHLLVMKEELAMSYSRILSSLCRLSPNLKPVAEDSQRIIELAEELVERN